MGLVNTTVPQIEDPTSLTSPHPTYILRHVVLEGWTRLPNNFFKNHLSTLT